MGTGFHEGAAGRGYESWNISQEFTMRSTLRHLDPDIFAAARKALDDDPGVPQDVRVHVDRGTVTLTGTVRNRHQKSEAEAVVHQVEGLRRVVNHITVANVETADDLDAPES
jgi:osmotically-inducible protein OsmY